MADTYRWFAFRNFSQNEVHQSRRAQTLTRLLKRINRGDDPRLLRKEAGQLLTNITPGDITTAEQHLIDDGYSIQVVQLLSATFMLMGISQQPADNPITSLPPNHILRMVMAEHDMFRCFLADLDELAEIIAALGHLTDVSMEFRKLVHIVEHLGAMKEHIEREDDIIFPYLRDCGRISLCRAVQGDHVNIRTEIDGLNTLILSFDEVSLEQFKTGLLTTTQRLLAIAPEHLCQEDFILYPIALGIINNTEVWEEMKAICDEIGYCALHLQSGPRSGNPRI